MDARVEPPRITASAVYVLDGDTGDVYYESGGLEGERRPKSIAKLATALVLFERQSRTLGGTVAINSELFVGGSGSVLEHGDEWSWDALLWAMLLPSSNDAANVVGYHLGRDILKDEGREGAPIERFVEEMNGVAARLGARHTAFRTPHGNDQAESCARDIALLTKAAILHPALKTYCSKARHRVGIRRTGIATAVELETTNIMARDQGVCGGKTGTGLVKGIYNLVLVWEAPNGHRIVGVILGSADDASRYTDMRAIKDRLPIDFPQLARGQARASQTSP